jgi:hypothetical protein
MNNNNNFNINSWIGINHLDFFKNSSNDLYFYTSNTSNILSNQIIITSNILENDILITSNILEISSSNKTSNLRYDINKLINEETEHISLPVPYDLKHTYIYNSNLLGEIRFWCKSTTDFPVFIPLGVPDYRVKIDVDGKLKVYYTYDPSINATFGNGWVDVANSIVALNASDANIGVSLAGLGASIASNYLYFEQKIENLLFGLKGLGILNDNDIKGLLERFSKFKYETFPTNTAVASIFQDIKEFFRTGLSNFLERAVNNITIRITQNPTASFFLGLGGLAFAGATGAIQNMQYLEIISTILNSNITSNSNISSQRRIDILSSNTDEYISSTMDYCSNMYNFSIAQGFLNSNIITQQYLNSINTNEIKISQTNISNIFVASNVLSNINLNEGFLNCNITNQQYLSNLKCDNLNLNNGNITAVNTISVNTINISGKVKQFGNYLDDTYLKPEDLYNLSYNYTIERRYPPKAYNSSTTEKSVNFLNTLVYNQTLILDNIGITYGDGQYEIYSSSTYDNGITNKDKLFDFDNTQTINTPRWGINQYSSGFGDYQGNSSIDGVHNGDFIIIKLPLPILLTRFRFYKNTSFPQLAPSLWKCFGSFDGIEWFEIFQAHNFTRLTEANYNLGYYEKTLANTFTTLFNYIGFSFNSLVGTSGATSLNFAELQLFGKEQLSYNIDSYKYTTPEAVKVVVRDDMPDVPKRRGFIVSIPASATYFDGNTTFYKYDLDLRLYTKTKIIENTTDLMRIFKIRFWYVPSYFGYHIDGQPWVNSYEIYMSNKQNAILGQPETAGLNIIALGNPENLRLANVLLNQLMLLKNAFGSLNYLTIVSRTAPADVYVIIEDML